MHIMSTDHAKENKGKGSIKEEGTYREIKEKSRGVKRS